MSAIFPSLEWLQALEEKLNNDEKYAQVAKNWEGDMAFIFEADDRLAETTIMYIDLWHGKCRGVAMWDDLNQKVAFTVTAVYTDFVRVLEGDLDPMQAMLTRKLLVKGNMAVMMRNVPTVLDFVRCARIVTDGTL